MYSENASKASDSSPTIEVRAESAIRAMETLIQTSFGRASPSRAMEEETCGQSLSVECRVQSKGSDEAGSEGSSCPPSVVTVHVPPSPETPRRARTPTIDANIEEDRDLPQIPNTSSTTVLPDADSSTCFAVSRDHDKEDQLTSRLEKNLLLDMVDETRSLKRRATDVNDPACSDAKRRAEDRQQTRQNSDMVDHADDDGDDRPTSTSGRLTALESLQGLVYRQTLSSEHPLDSLQRLIYGNAGADASHVSVQLAGAQSAAGSGGADVDQFQNGRSPVLAPQTLILVNPIVTVVSQGGSTEVSVPGGLTTPKQTACTGGGGGSAGESSGSSEDAGEQAVPVPRTYRCRACRRKFSSRGSYRYHLSRCHVLASAASPKAASEAPSRHKYHSHRHRDDDPDMSVASQPSSDVTVSGGSAFGSCAPLEDSGRRLQAPYFAEAK